ncbi:MAG: 3'(2'),5'-bisphosphate nucleotidase CysQ [Alphaproteobacteria bacterium]|nr:3'(2'),5'-bisphosphate nucleotidase CysQ [Alphaproteobacteria bacterium]
MNKVTELVENNIDDLLEVVVGAGDIIMKYFNDGFKTFIKSDGSPVTEADLAADKFISSNLAKIIPGVFMVSEEGYESDKSGFNDIPDVFWCVDPLDGTKNFIKKDSTFTVNIGLVVNKKPVFGMLYVPHSQRLYYSTKSGGYKIHQGAKVKLQSSNMTDVNIITSKRTSDKHIQKLIRNVESNKVICKYTKMASSEKFCYLADSNFNVFPSFASSSEWDTAAGHSILKSVGGNVFSSIDHELEYGKKGFKNPSFIALSNPKKIPHSLISNLLQILD